ncbi:hypothetical protein FACS1894211_00130 [Clostridia bacterium]|nr:hypothetical protein FACS1894211_00130 [Clostridia bacterium]
MRFYKHKIENLIVVDRIVTVHFPRFPAGYVFAGETHDFWELVYAERGEAICTRGDTDIRLIPGNVLFHKPGEFHKIRTSGNASPQILIVAFVCKSPAMAFFAEKQFEVAAERDALLRNILSEAKQTFRLYDFNPDLRKLESVESPNLGGQQMIRTYLEQFLILSMRDRLKTAQTEAFVDPAARSRQIETMVVRYLRENLYEKLSLTDVCAKFNYGKTFLCTQFKKNTDRTIMNYFLYLKIEESKKLLLSGKHTVKEIAYLLNFDSSAYFTAAFKRAVSLTPKEFAKRGSSQNKVTAD